MDNSKLSEEFFKNTETVVHFVFFSPHSMAAALNCVDTKGVIAKKPDYKYLLIASFIEKNYYYVFIRLEQSMGLSFKRVSGHYDILFPEI